MTPRHERENGTVIIDDVPDDPLDIWKPEPAEYARAGELWDYCLAVDDPRFNDAFNGACADVLTERNLPRFLAAIFLHGRDLIEGNCTDQKLARLRLTAAVNVAREEAIREAAWRDDTD
jgi:hypothetical protein